MEKDDLIDELLSALEAAQEHLDYTGYGDSWERECARESKLAERIEEAVIKGQADRLQRTINGLTTGAPNR